MTAVSAQPYAVMLKVAGRLAVVVGSGLGAIRAANSLLAHGADVVVIAPEVSDDLLRMEAEGELSVEVRQYKRGDLDSAFVVIVASGSAEIDAAVATEAREGGVLVNMAGDAAASDFIVPSVVRRGALQIAVTTAGGAPSVAREVRRGIATAYGPEWEAYTRLVTELRVLAIERTGRTDSDLAPLFTAVADSDLRARLAAGEKVTAEALFEEHAGTVTGPADAVASGATPAD